jgi:hypothetical protein
MVRSTPAGLHSPRGYENWVLWLTRFPRRNLAALASRIKIMNTDYRPGVANGNASTDRLLITFIAPPRGDALSRTSGLDLRRTTPPITEIVDFLVHRFGQSRLLFTSRSTKRSTRSPWPN